MKTYLHSTACQLLDEDSTTRVGAAVCTCSDPEKETPQSAAQGASMDLAFVIGLLDGGDLGMLGGAGLGQYRLEALMRLRHAHALLQPLAYPRLSAIEGGVE